MKHYSASRHVSQHRHGSSWHQRADGSVCLGQLLASAHQVQAREQALVLPQKGAAVQTAVQM